VRRTKSSIAALLCASLILPALPVAQAVAAPVGKTAITKSSEGVTLVGRRGGWGPGAGAIIGGLIVGGLIAASIREGRADDRDMRRCDRDFRGFDPRTGTYIDRYGDERICPYLR
jgi:hypothetical protein